jgi:uncharacterized 2Fe-2S/4Fe-4S cluster protein (DUF4445 family)
MNTLDYYNRQKYAWDAKEVEDLISEYNIKQMTISQIADNHYRTPGVISYKLKNLGIITNNTYSRGYVEYKNSSLYKEIVETGKMADIEKKIKRVIKQKEKIETIPINKPSNEINEVKKEIENLKNDVKEILRLINAIYDFKIKDLQL